MFQRTLRQTTWQMVRKTVANRMAEPLQYLLITLKVIQKILRLFVNILTVNDKHYLLNRDNLTQPIQMQLSKKQKTFSEFFFQFLKSI